MKEATEMGGSDDEKDEWREWRGERERAVGEPLWILMCAQVVVDRTHTTGSTINYFISIGLLHIFVI